jgi:WD40 repeat protein
MRLPPKPPRGMWLATGLAWAAACAAYWALPVQPRSEWLLPQTFVRLGFLPGRRALLFWEGGAPPGPERYSRGSVRLYDADSGRVREWFTPDGPVYALPFGAPFDDRWVSADGRWLALLHHRGDAPALRVYGLPGGTPRADLPFSFEYGDLRGLALAGDRLAFADRAGGCVRLWDLAAGREVAVLPAAGDILAVAPDGRTLAVAARARTPEQQAGPIHVWDVVRQRPVATLTGPDLRGLVNLWFSPDGGHVAAAFLRPEPSVQGLVCCWAVADGTVTVRAEGGSVGLRPGRPWVFGPGNRGARAVRVFDYAGGFTQLALGPNDWPAHNGVSQDGLTLAVVSVFKDPVAAWLGAWGVTWPFRRTPVEQLRFIDVATGREVGHLPPGSDGPEDMFTPDGRLFVTSAGGIIRVWDVPPRRPLAWVLVAALPAVPLAWLARRLRARGPTSDAASPPNQLQRITSS